MCVIYFKRIQEILTSEQSREDKRPFRCAFVFFKSVKSRTIALQTIWTDDPMTFHVSPAPDASDINWGTLKMGYPSRSVRRLQYPIMFLIPVFSLITY